MFAFVTDSTVQSVGTLPTSARRLDTGGWVLGLLDAGTDTQRACGWFEVTETTPPASTGGTVESTVELVDGTPTRVWTERPLTPEEQAAATEEANASTIEVAITAALTQLDTLIAAPPVPTVPAGTMSTAQLSTALRTLRDATQANRAGAQDIARTLKRTIRLVRGDFDGTD